MGCHSSGVRWLCRRTHAVRVPGCQADSSPSPDSECFVVPTDDPPPAIETRLSFVERRLVELTREVRFLRGLVAGIGAAALEAQSDSEAATNSR